jgi:DNA-binding MarR family transcriptional regulator
MSEDSLDRITASMQTLGRLEGSRRFRQQLAAAAGVSISGQGLRLLERTLECGSTTPSQLAVMMDADSAVITRLLRQLEGAGLIGRARSPQDRRVSTVEATPQGREACSRIREVMSGQLRRSLEAWPESDVDELARLIARLVADLQKDPPRRPPRPAPCPKGITVTPTL